MKLILPLTVTLPRKTKEDRNFILNLNVYRNTHHHTLNQAKVAYKELVTVAVGDQKLEYPPPYLFRYTVFPGSNRAFDLANVLPIIQKFTDDALIEQGVIQDDNHKIVACVIYHKGDLDKESPRAELEIVPYPDLPNVSRNPEYARIIRVEDCYMCPLYDCDAQECNKLHREVKQWDGIDPDCPLELEKCD